MWNGTYFGCTIEPLIEAAKDHKSVKSEFSGHNIRNNYKHAWEGIGETLGFCPSTSNVQGDIVAVNGRLSQLNSDNQVAT